MSFTLLVADLANLATESRRKFTDVRDAAERAQALAKTPDDALRDLQRVDGPSSVVLSPILLGCQSKNAKVIAAAVACLQRLVAIKGAVTQYTVPVILQTLKAVITQGVEIQLKILQCLVALLTSCKNIHNATLADALLLCFRLQDSKIGVVSSTAAATLRQLVMIVFEGVVEEDHAGESIEAKSAVLLPDGSMTELGPSAADAFHVFEDLCILVGAPDSSSAAHAQTPNFLKLTHLPKTFGLELIESVLSDFWRVFLRHTELLTLLRTYLAPLVLKGLSERPSTFPTMTRYMRVAFLLMKQFSVPLEAELEVFLHLFVRIIDTSGIQGSEETWTRVLALEIMRGVCSDFELLLRVWQHFGDVFMGALTALGKLAMEKPALLGSTIVPAANGPFVLPGGIAGDAVNSVLEMAAQAASTVGVLPATGGPVAGLAVETAAVKVQCIDQLDKAEPPAMPETYPYLLALQCLVAVANGFFGYINPYYARIFPSQPPPPPSVPFDREDSSEDVKALRPVRQMVDSAWPALLSSLSFYLSVNLDDQLFDNTLAGLQSFAKTCGILDLATPRDAFLTSLCRFAVPSSTPTEVSPLSTRNLACLRSVVAIANALAGSLGTAWLLVFEALQTAELILRKSPPDVDDLFQRTCDFDDPSFATFLGALCRLDGEVIGMPVNEKGVLDLDLNEPRSPGVLQRRGTSTIVKSMKPGEKSIFGISRLGDVSTSNVNRLVRSEASLGWDIVTSHLLAVQHWSTAPAPIRLQAAQVLDRLLELALRDADEATQTRIFDALADQSEAEPGPQSASDLEVRRMGLDALHRILESTGQSLICGWQRIFGILASACPGRLVRVAFPALQLICTDFLAALDIAELRLCVSTLSSFGQQKEDVNIALTAGGLLWQVSDHLQARRKEANEEEAATFSELWMFLLHQLLALSEDEKQEVRDGAIQTIFRNLELYGTTLSADDWDVLVWSIVFPLLDSLDAAIRTLPVEPVRSKERPTSIAEEMRQGPPGLLTKQWDASKTLALSSIGDIFADHLEEIKQTKRFDETWSTLLQRCQVAFTRDHASIATAAMKAFARVTKADSSKELLDVAWHAWDEAGADVLEGGKETIYTQASLEAFVVALPRPLAIGRDARLLEILFGVIIYAGSPDARLDVDSVNPVQRAIIDAIGAIPPDDENGVAARVLSMLARCIGLAFGRHAGSHATYVGLCKLAMPRAVQLVQERAKEQKLFRSGAVAELISTLAQPMRLKYACPPAARYGDDAPLWRTATLEFLPLAKLCLSTLDNLSVPYDVYREVYKRLMEGCRGALLADCRPALYETLSEQQALELLDLRILSLIEIDLLPRLTDQRIPDELIGGLASTLQLGSRLYDLDLPALLTPPLTPVEEGELKVESRFSRRYEDQARSDIFGTTASIVEAPKERVAYWCFDLLFSLCRAASDKQDRSRIARLALPLLMSRCEACLRTYLVDRPLRGRMPFARVREEEMVYILDQLIRLEVDGQAFSAASWSTEKGKRLRDGLETSSKAHLLRLHNLFVSLLVLPRPTIALPQVIFERDATAEALQAGLQLGSIGQRAQPIQGGLHDLAAECLEIVGDALYS